MSWTSIASLKDRRASVGLMPCSRCLLSVSLSASPRGRTDNAFSRRASHSSISTAVWSLWDMSRFQNYVPEGPSASGLSSLIGVITGRKQVAVSVHSHHD
jgi:hypothetical protein